MENFLNVTKDLGVCETEAELNSSGSCDFIAINDKYVKVTHLYVLVVYT